MGPAPADLPFVALGLTDGARLMRASFDVVRRDLRLLWFPVISTACLALTACFWIFEGAWLKAVSGPGIFFALLVLAGLYSLYFVGIFFSVAVAGAAAEVIDGGDPSIADGLNVAWSSVGGIAGWAAYSVVVGLLLGLVKSIRGLRWLGDLAQVAWSFATIFVVPLIALEGLDPESAAAARSSWRRGTGRRRPAAWPRWIVLLVPGLLIYLDAEAAGERPRPLARRQGAARDAAGLRARPGGRRERGQAGVRGDAVPDRDSTSVTQIAARATATSSRTIQPASKTSASRPPSRLAAMPTSAVGSSPIC